MKQVKAAIASELYFELIKAGYTVLGIAADGQLVMGKINR